MAVGCGGTSDDTSGEDASLDGGSRGDAPSADARAESAVDRAPGDTVLDESARGDVTVEDGSALDTGTRDASQDGNVGDSIDSSTDRDARGASDDGALGDLVVHDTDGESDSDSDAPTADTRTDVSTDDVERDASFDRAVGDANPSDVGGGDIGAGDAVNGDALTDGRSDDATRTDGLDPDAWSHNPRATISFLVQAYDSTHPTHGQHRCPPYRHWINVPYQRDRPPATQYQQLDDTAALATSIDGLNQDAIACTVKPNGASFQVSTDGTGYAENLGQILLPVLVHIRIASIVNGGTASGTLSFQDDATGSTVYFSDECVFSTQGGSLGVSGGRIWGSVKCENVHSTEPDTACQIDTGYFLFENCGQ